MLFTASIDKHILRFHIPYLVWFKKNGWETHVACAGSEHISNCDRRWNVPFERSPYSYKHILSYNKLKSVLQQVKFDIIHCHTPMTGLLTRLAARSFRKTGTKVLYTAHGFHFYKGGPWFNWIFYFPIEVFSARFTDAIITINGEDLKLIRKWSPNHVKCYKIPGIGVNSSRFFQVSDEDKIKIRNEFGFKRDDFILIYAGEFIHRKNHKFLIKAVNGIREEIPTLKVLLAGRGKLDKSLKALVKQENLLEQCVFFLGFRSDINRVYQMSDIGVSVSKQEGLGLNLIEEMLCGLPVIATDDRGHKEIIQHGENGLMFPHNSYRRFRESVVNLYKDLSLRSNISEAGKGSVGKFELENSIQAMNDIYKNYI